MHFPPFSILASMSTTVLALNNPSSHYPPWGSLADKLSPGASLHLPNDTGFKTVAGDVWSEQLTQQIPRAVISVATEEDILASVHFGIKYRIPFRARAGGHGLQSSIKSPGFIIDFKGYNEISVDTEANTVTLQAGVLNKQMQVALAEQGTCTPSPGANTVGLMGALLGGGFAADSGLRGLMVDNLISAKVISGEKGKLITVSATENADLFYGIKGAGHSLGVVTEVVLKTYPFAEAPAPARRDGNVWSASFIYPPSQLGEVTKFIWENRRDDATFTFLFTSPPPAFQDEPIIMLALSFYGADSDLPPILTSLENLQPVFNDSALTPYQNVNDGLDPWCEHAGRKAFYGTGLTKVHPEAVVAVWNSYLKFWRSNKDFGKTAFTLDVLGKKAIEDVDEDKTAFPHRGVNGYANAVPWYNNASNDRAARKWGEEVREILRTVPRTTKVGYYVNNAVGTEKLEDVYGGKERLAKLRRLKQKWDPKKVYGYEDFTA